MASCGKRSERVRCGIPHSSLHIFLAPRNSLFRARAEGAAGAAERKNFFCIILGAKIIIKNLIRTAAIVFCLPLVGTAQIFVRPGDTGAIEFPIYSDATSVEPAEGVTILTEAPSLFIVKNTSILGPSFIQPAGTKNFIVDYEISPDATEGPFEVVLNVNMDSLNVYPDTDTLTTSVDFPGSLPLFPVVAVHKLVFHSVFINSLKFTDQALAISLGRTWRTASYARHVASCRISRYAVAVPVVLRAQTHG
jgi:hypothetical protein